MKEFMSKDFLLSTETAKYLYHNHAAKMPVIDYHCHINPKEIADNKRYENISEVWLGGDHYKWRAIRSNGVEEKYITGKDSSPKEKFDKWAETLTKAIGNPLFHWTHLELKKYFGYEGVLSAKTADKVWELCNAKLQEEDMSARGIIEKSNVKLICTTDDPIDSLEYHAQIKADATCKVKVLPAFRPDPAVNIEKPTFKEYIEKLASVSGVAIDSVDSLLKALENRVEFFHSMGCLTSDHGLEYVPYKMVEAKELEEIFVKGLANEELSKDEIEAYKTAVVMSLAKSYARHKWVMQIHYGVNRNNNTKRFEQLGADTGFDSTGTFDCAKNMSQLFDALEYENLLPKTILYSINPADNEVLATLMGCFQSPEAKCKVQLGSAWWFNDTKPGMQKQLTDLASLSLLGNFVGMLTDSRSFLSYTRHEYFRRILCELIGGWVENGEYPNDREALGQMVEDISYNNTVNYFGFEV
jgi:glucuronate isomerase